MRSALHSHCGEEQKQGSQGEAKTETGEAAGAMRDILVFSGSLEGQ